MNNIIIYSTPSCPYCNMAKHLLTSLELDYEDVDISKNPKDLEELIRKTKMQTVPQIFINDKFIGGFDNLNNLKQNDQLKDFLK